jgi:hypothetical protein
MIHLLDATMEQYLRAEVPLDDRVDIAYNAPDDEWSSRLTRPTVNLFVWDIRRNVTEAHGGIDLVERENERFHRPVLPRIDFRYLITTWTNEVRDEHELLGALLVTALRVPTIPLEYLQGGLAEVMPLPRINVARFDGAESSEFWSSVGGKLKAALDVVVSASVDTSVLRPAGPPALGVDLTSRAHGTDAPSRRMRNFASMLEESTGRSGGGSE